MLWLLGSVSAATVHFDRPQNAAHRPVAVATFAVPPGLRAEGGLEVVAAGHHWPVQKGADGQAHVIIADAAGAKLGQGILVPAKRSEAAEAVRAIRTGDRIELRLGDRLVAAYRTEGVLPRPGVAEVFRRGGYLHPLLTPAGREVTDDYPSNHLHHHGVWTAWTKTRFQGRTPDFWNMGDREGRVEFVAVDAVWSGPVQGGFRARHRYVDLSVNPPVAALEESWEVRLYNLGAEWNRKVHLLELTITQRTITDAPLELPEYHYGGLGVRGNWAWNGAGACRWLTSAGHTDPLRGNATRAQWCWLGGPLADGIAGVAILGAGDNFRAPEPVRLHPSEPFFCFAPSQGGAWAISPGRAHVARYRLVVANGEPDSALLHGLWDDFAHPLTFTIAD